MPLDTSFITNLLTFTTVRWLLPSKYWLCFLPTKPLAILRSSRLSNSIDDLYCNIGCKVDLGWRERIEDCPHSFGELYFVMFIKSQTSLINHYSYVKISHSNARIN